MKAVITVIGKDQKGIIAQMTDVLWRHGGNIRDITQNVLGDIFAMIMMADIDELKHGFGPLKEALEAEGERLGLKVLVMHEDIFNSMHRI